MQPAVMQPVTSPDKCRVAIPVILAGIPGSQILSLFWLLFSFAFGRKVRDTAMKDNNRGIEIVPLQSHLAVTYGEGEFFSLKNNGVQVVILCIRPEGVGEILGVSESWWTPVALAACNLLIEVHKVNSQVHRAMEVKQIPEIDLSDLCDWPETDLCSPCDLPCD